MGGPALLVAGAIIGCLSVYREGKWLNTAIATIVGTVIGGLLYCVISAVLLNLVPTEQYSQGKHDLLPLTESYYLGNGSVNGTIEWSYMEKAPQGNTITTAKANSILVNQDKGLKKAYVETVTKRFTNSKIETMFPAEFLAGSAIVIHVPENAIKYGYNLSVNN